MVSHRGARQKVNPLKRNHSDSHERKMRQAWQRIADIMPGNQEAARAFIQLKWTGGPEHAGSTLRLQQMSHETRRAV